MVALVRLSVTVTVADSGSARLCGFPCTSIASCSVASVTPAGSSSAPTAVAESCAASSPLVM